MMERPWCRFRREARARERHRHCIDGESLIALYPNRPIREADIARHSWNVRFVPLARRICVSKVINGPEADDIVGKFAAHGATARVNARGRSVLERSRRDEGRIDAAE